MSMMDFKVGLEGVTIVGCRQNDLNSQVDRPKPVSSRFEGLIYGFTLLGAQSL